MKSKRLTRLGLALCLIIIAGTLLELFLEIAHPTTGEPVQLVIQDVLFMVFPVVYTVLAALIVTHQPYNPIGWLLFVPGIFSISEIFANLYLQASPMPPTTGFLPLLIAWFFSWSWMLFIFPIFIIPVLFPTGRPISPRWWWVIYLTLGMFGLLVFTATFGTSLDLGNGNSITNPIGFLSSGWWDFWQTPWDVGLVVLTISSAASLFVRYWRAGIVEREQLKWLLYACGVFLVGYIPSVIWSDSTGPVQVVSSLVFIIGILVIPAGIAIAILRYRLWDIDVIIRRTLVYGMLTVLLGIVYFGGVVLLQQLFGKVTDQEGSPLAIVLSTLVIAALFNPLRGRLQNFIDRRFYRSKYDAEQAMAKFAQTARSEVAIERLSIEMLETVKHTLQPEKVNLWLNPALQKKNINSQEQDAR
jgi:hypothetical protein